LRHPCRAPGNRTPERVHPSALLTTLGARFLPAGSPVPGSANLTMEPTNLVPHRASPSLATAARGFDHPAATAPTASALPPADPIHSPASSGLASPEGHRLTSTGDGTVSPCAPPRLFFLVACAPGAGALLWANPGVLLGVLRRSLVPPKNPRPTSSSTTCLPVGLPPCCCCCCCYRTPQASSSGGV
jgi:hypothetical protein